MEWQPIETAPKDGTHIDLWAKCWRAEADDFIYARFPSCKWAEWTGCTNRAPCWTGLDNGWRATHWMPLPEPPIQAATGKTE